MAGRPPLRIGQHVKIVREHRGGGVWLARARFRDADGVTRRVQRSGPADEFDKHGKLAKDALLIALAERQPPVGPAATVKRDLVDPISLLIATGLRGLVGLERTDQVDKPIGAGPTAQSRLPVPYGKRPLRIGTRLASSSDSPGSLRLPA